MPYRDLQSFQVDYDAAAALARQKYGAFYHDVDVNVAWNAYTNAGKTTDPDQSVLGLMLFGRHMASMKAAVSRAAQDAFNKRQEAINAEDERLKKKLLVPSPYRKYKTNKATTESFAQLEREKQNVPANIDTDRSGAMVENFGLVNNNDSGAILLMGNENWNLTINDCWVLGAVHSNLDFYPASAVSRANIYDDKYVLSITGRELFGLALFGYRQVVSAYEALGSAFESADPRKAADATLVAYQTAMSSLTEQTARETFETAGFRIVDVGL